MVSSKLNYFLYVMLVSFFNTKKWPFSNVDVQLGFCVLEGLVFVETKTVLQFAPDKIVEHEEPRRKLFSND